MPLDERDYNKNDHPPSCTCVECTNKRLKRLQQETHSHITSICPRCGEKSLWYNFKKNKYECLNLKCMVVLKTPNETPGKIEKPIISTNKIRDWLIALLLIFAACFIGLGLSMFASNYIPLWLTFNFSLIYSLEKVLHYFTRKYKLIGRLYRLILNLSILSLFGLLIWSVIKIFSHQFLQSSLASGLILFAELVFFVWIWRIIAKNSWRWPSMKLTTFSLVILFLLLTFTGVQPMSNYKDNILSKISDNVVDIFDSMNGKYKNYYFGLVKNPLPIGGSGCYDTENGFIILINNKNAKNPSYSELFNFLLSDKTDEFPYWPSLSTSKLVIYYGMAEDKINVGHIKDIIDGNTQPGSPYICADFAERLHNKAEMAGIRCGYVVVNNLKHALNVFDTTDKGLVFIDDTGQSLEGRLTLVIPHSITFGKSNRWDKVAYVEAGKPYGLISLECVMSFGINYLGYEKWLVMKTNFDTLTKQYNELGGGRVFVPKENYDQLQNIIAQQKELAMKLGGFWESLGTVDSYYITWDGNWRDKK